MQIGEDELSLSELQVSLDSMNINVPALPIIGNGKVTCGNCHHRGHRNQTNQPCELQKCSSYTYCGIRDKHLEYFAEMNKLKASIKKKRDDLKALQEQLTGIKNFVSQSEHQFLKALTPHMMKVGPSYKVNKQKLLRDIHILRKFYNGKIPVETTNDAEQLHITLSKCKQMLEHDVGEVAVQGIKQYEQSRGINDGNAINLNVTMSVSPESTNSVSNSGVMNSMSMTNSVVPTHQETVVQETNTSKKQNSGKARKLVFKHKRKKSKSKKSNKDLSSSLSESESQSESTTSSSSDDDRKYIKKKRKRKSKQNHASRNAERVEAYIERSKFFDKRNLHSKSNQNFLATQEYRQNIAPRPPTQMIFPSTSYYPFPTATYDGQRLPVQGYNYGMSEINPFSCNLRQWANNQASFTNRDKPLLVDSSSDLIIPGVTASNLCENTSVIANLPNNDEIDGLAMLSSVVEAKQNDKER